MAEQTFVPNLHRNEAPKEHKWSMGLFLCCKFNINLATVSKKRMQGEYIFIFMSQEEWMVAQLFVTDGAVGLFEQ